MPNPAPMTSGSPSSSRGLPILSLVVALLATGAVIYAIAEVHRLREQIGRPPVTEGSLSSLVARLKQLEAPLDLNYVRRYTNALRAS